MRAATPSELRLLIFDWDGTLIDSIAAITACARAALAELELPSPPTERVHSVIGLGLRESVETLAPGCDEETFGRIVAVYRRLWFERYCQRPLPFPGIDELLPALRRRRHLLAIATAKSRRGLDHDLERSGLGEYFDAIRTADEALPKPHPRMLLEILEELGVAAGESLMIGDTPHDLEMAAAAGVASLAVASGSYPAAALARSTALACLAGVHELPGWLDGVAAGSALAGD